MYIQTDAEIVTQVSAQGYVTKGAVATQHEKQEGVFVDVEAVYELGAGEKARKASMLKDLTAQQLEQVEEQMIERYEAMERFE